MNLKVLWTAFTHWKTADRDICVTQKNNAEGDSYFEVYDARHHKRNVMSSSREVQIWLDQQHY